MCFKLRYTARRGFPEVPEIFVRICFLTRLRCSLLRLVIVVLRSAEPAELFGTCSSRCFACLPSDIFAFVFDPLSLVWFRGSERSDLCGDLTDKLLIDSLDDDTRLSRSFDGDAVRWYEQNWMGIPHLDLDFFSLQ